MGQRCDRHRLWELLGELVAEKRSGTLYIRSDDAHAGVISLREGEVVSILYRSELGEPAVELIRQISGGTCRFDTSAPAITGAECPPTAVILDALAQPGQGTGKGLADAAARHMGDKADLQKFLRDLSGHLKTFIGPIAPVVVKDAVAEMGQLDRIDQAESLISRLMGEIDDQHDASSFLSAALDSLSKMQSNAR